MSKRKADDISNGETSLPSEFSDEINPIIPETALHKNESIANKKKPKKPKKKRIEIEKLKLPQVKIALPKFTLQNVVATFNLGVDHLDLRAIALAKPFVEYNPQKFAAASLRIRNPRTTALAFASGNMVCTGARTEIESRYAGRKYVRILQKHGIPVSFRNFKIQNIVASSEVPFALKLVELAAAYGPYVSYEPDLFPGLVFRTSAPKLVFLIFRSGKVVITGAKCRSEIESTWKALFHGIIQKFIDLDDKNGSSSDYRSLQRRKNHNKN
jgi:transcription initiation factor TFIID TATA-box-binding protein